MARLRMSSSEAGFACDLLPDSAVLPSLVVFDLDHTLWTPGMCVVCVRESVCGWQGMRVGLSACVHGVRMYACVVSEIHPHIRFPNIHVYVY